MAGFKTKINNTYTTGRFLQTNPWILFMVTQSTKSRPKTRAAEYYYTGGNNHEKLGID